MSGWKAVAALAALAGCAEFGVAPASPAGEPVLDPPLEASALATSYQREFEKVYTETPFANGALSVMATEGGELRGWTLAPCGGGTAICGGSAQGPAGRLVRTPDYVVVEGLYGRRFWLSYGGDGYVERNGTLVPLAWDARLNGTGPGTAPAVETPFRHR